MKNLKKYYFRKPWAFTLIVFLKFLVSLCWVLVSYILYYIVEMSSTATDYMQFVYVGLGVFAFLIVMNLASHFEMAGTHKYVNEMTEDLRHDVFESIIGSDFETLNSQTAGEYLSMVQKDVDGISGNHFESVFNLISQVMTLVMAIAMSFFFNYVITLMILALSILIVLVPKLFHKKIQGSYKDISDSVTELSKYMDNFLDGALIVRNMDALHRIALLVEERERKVIRSKNRHWNIISANSNLTGFLVTVMQFLITFIAGLMTYLGTSSVSVAVAMLEISSFIFNPIIEIVTSSSYVMSVKDVVEKLSGFKKGDLGVVEGLSNPSIELRNLSVSFDDKKILDDASYTFEYGKKYLVFGKSGIGKSTLLDSIFGYVKHSEGSIEFVGDGKESECSDGSSLIGYVHQKPYLFIGTLLQNITMYEENPDMERVERVIELCQLSEFAKQRGLDENLDSTENKISVGEMQRISLARVLYRNKPVLFLDEITSSLDPDNTDKIYKTIESIQDKLVIWISHDRTAKKLDWMDHEITIEDGKIVDAK